MKYFAVLIWLLMDALNYSPFLIEGPSMEPAMESGQVVMIDRGFSKEGLSRGDIVVFALAEEPDYFYVKRIIGLPGEKITIKKDGLYLQNGEEEEKLKEPYLGEGAYSVPVSEGYRENYAHSYDIPPDKYFVLGDNREHSLDSRYFKSPFVSQTEITGKYLFNISQS